MVGISYIPALISALEDNGECILADGVDLVLRELRLLASIADEVEKLLDSAVGTDENSINQSEYLVSAGPVEKLGALMVEYAES